jgi:hypothetical protein
VLSDFLTVAELAPDRWSLCFRTLVTFLVETSEKSDSDCIAARANECPPPSRVCRRNEQDASDNSD